MVKSGWRGRYVSSVVWCLTSPSPTVGTASSALFFRHTQYSPAAGFHGQFMVKSWSNISKCQQMSKNASKCQQMSANVSKGVPLADGGHSLLCAVFSRTPSTHLVQGLGIKHFDGPLMVKLGFRGRCEYGGDEFPRRLERETERE
jgi:hypothetical protein